MDFREQLRTTLGGYTVERELGDDGKSRVLVAEDIQLGQRILVKLLRQNIAADMSAARFEEEIRLAAQLHHPHIVPLLSAGAINELPYYTMAFVEGESLRARLSRDGPLKITDALRLIRELADGLAYAHAQGVVHHDLEPEKVLLSAGHAMVMDFGVAKAILVATLDGRTEEKWNRWITSADPPLPIGTLGYMAPEQFLAEPAIDHRADLYALGVIAYEILVGQRPFPGDSLRTVISAQITEVAPSVRDRRPEVPRAVAKLVSRLLQKRPVDRPQSAAEVMAALDSIGSPTEEQLAAAYVSRKRIRAAAVAVALALTAFIALLANFRAAGH